jgi:dolichol-phosphate mannosyltransferase
MLDVSVVLPTYNEAENVPIMVKQIHGVLNDSGIDGEIIVVDDDSPDKTGEVADEIAKDYPVQVIVRKKDRGLSRAVLEGFNRSEAKVCIVMDADGSHPVEKLPEMIKPILSGDADATVGTRYIDDGGISDWPWYRLLISRFAGLLAFGVSRLSDPTSGFMGIRRDKLEGQDFNPIGWKIVLEIIVKASPLTMKEVPIVFKDREHGESKMSTKENWNYILHLLSLYNHKFKSIFEFIKFGLVGFSGVFVDMLAVILLKEIFAYDTRLCAFFGFSVAVTYNYVLNRSWTFDGAKSIPVYISYPKYILSSSGGFLIRLLLVHVLITKAGLDAGYWYIVTNLVGIIAGMLFNFITSKYFVFKQISSEKVTNS